VLEEVSAEEVLISATSVLIIERSVSLVSMLVSKATICSKLGKSGGFNLKTGVVSEVIPRI